MSVTVAETVKTNCLIPAHQNNYSSVFRERLKGKINMFENSFSQC